VTKTKSHNPAVVITIVKKFYSTGVNIIKLFCLKFTNFRNKLEVCPWQYFLAYHKKHSSLVRKFANYRQKCFTTFVPGHGIHSTDISREIIQLHLGGLLKMSSQGAYSQHFIFFVTYEWAQ
jgi:hypothetical protein